MSLFANLPNSDCNRHRVQNIKIKKSKNAYDPVKKRGLFYHYLLYYHMFSSSSKLGQ